MSHRGNEPEWDPLLSRHADGQLDADEHARLEASLAGDPERAELLDTWRQAMDLWRDDASRRAATLDFSALASRALDASRPTRRTSASVRRYAAAAVVLMGLGIGGAAWLGPRPDQTSMLRTGTVIRMIEQERLDHHGRVEWELRPMPGRTTGNERER